MAACAYTSPLDLVLLHPVVAQLPIIRGERLSTVRNGTQMNEGYTGVGLQWRMLALVGTGYWRQ